MINALFASREGGTKELVVDDVRFGWDAIISMSKGLTRMIPKMKEAFIIRDSWTKVECHTCQNYAG